MFCKMCGKKIHDESRFCPYCGAAVGTLEAPVTAEKEENIETAVEMPVKAEISGISETADEAEIEQKEPEQQEAETIQEKTKTPEQHEDYVSVKKGMNPKLVIVPVVVAAVAVGAWIGLGKKSASKPEQQEAEYTTEAQAQETEESAAEEETKLAVPFAEGGQAEVSDGITPEEYILPECEIRAYTKDELSVLSADELRLARNEIYARHGRMFNSEDLKNYFQSKSWYTPQYEGTEFDAKGDSILNKYEIANRNLIVELEGGDTASSIAKIDYKGNYKFKGDEYVWVKNYYIKDNVLYVEGEYCDGVYNPDAPDEGSSMDFYTVKDNVVVRIDNNTVIKWESCKNINDIRDYLAYTISWAGSTAMEVDLDGDYVTVWYGNWQFS